MSQVTKSSPNKLNRMVSVLAHFMRTNYSGAAESETARHIAAYQGNSEHELAGIWISVGERLKKEQF